MMHLRPGSNTIPRSPAVPLSDNGMGEWIKFISDVCCDDIGLMGYLMTVFGMAAFGRVFEEGVYFALGTGRNGKSTTVNSVAHTMADYAGIRQH